MTYHPLKALHAAAEHLYILIKIKSFFIQISLPILFLFTGETFTTAVRSFGVGITSTAAKLGSVISPLVLYLDRIDNNLPLIVLSALMVLIIMALFPLPETKTNRSSIQWFKCVILWIVYIFMIRKNNVYLFVLNAPLNSKNDKFELISMSR